MDTALDTRGLSLGLKACPSGAGACFGVNCLRSRSRQWAGPIWGPWASEEAWDVLYTEPTSRA